MWDEHEWIKWMLLGFSLGLWRYVFGREGRSDRAWYDKTKKEAREKNLTHILVNLAFTERIVDVKRRELVARAITLAAVISFGSAIYYAWHG